MPIGGTVPSGLQWTRCSFSVKGPLHRKMLAITLDSLLPKLAGVNSWTCAESGQLMMLAMLNAPKVTTQPVASKVGSKQIRAKGGMRTTLVPADWITEALKVLVDKSVDGVRVDVLATLLHVTRGSFYYHFADRTDLLKRMLSTWKQRQTDHVIERYEQKDATPQSRIQELTELPFHGETAKNGAAVELAIRAWARRDELARSMVDEVDSLRLQYIRHCFEKLGFDEVGCRVRAFALYCYMQSESIFNSPGTDSDKLERRTFVKDILTR